MRQQSASRDWGQRQGWCAIFAAVEAVGRHCLVEMLHLRVEGINASAIEKYGCLAVGIVDCKGAGVAYAATLAWLQARSVTLGIGCLLT